jgi:HSP20 family molecular chaperone IbpA
MISACGGCGSCGACNIPSYQAAFQQAKLLQGKTYFDALGFHPISPAQESVFSPLASQVQSFAAKPVSWNMSNESLTNIPSRPKNAVAYFSMLNPIRLIDVEGNRKFELHISAKGYKPREVQVTLNKAERALIIEAQCEGKTKYSEVKRRAFRKYILPESLKNIDLTKFGQEMRTYIDKEGFLVVEAPLPRLTSEELKRWPHIPDSFFGVGPRTMERATHDMSNRALQKMAFRPKHSVDMLTLTNPVRVLDRDGHRKLEIVLSMKGYKASEIKTNWNKAERTIIVEAHAEAKTERGEMNRTYFRKYIVPEWYKGDFSQVELRTNLTSDGFLVIEGALPKLSQEELAKCPVMSSSVAVQGGQLTLNSVFPVVCKQ